MAQNEKILAGGLEIFRHNPQKQYRVDQIEREARRERLGNFTELIKALSFLEHEKKIIELYTGSRDGILTCRMPQRRARSN